MDHENLVGREAEVAELARLWGPGPQPGRVLLIEGEPGIGKTALLEVAQRFAEDAGDEVLKTVGVEAEARLPFAGLHQLVRGLVQDIPALGGAEPEALRSAFGEIVAQRAPEPALINQGTARLLRRAVLRRPLTVLVPWLAARLALAHGSWLRRTGQPEQATTTLHTARALLSNLGAVTWANRADEELVRLIG
ncbi:AAA family ATPase [Streptomyces griseorubiginosus]|nr:AAA family ATPase [Streptomyces griseorubiginosus]